MTVDGTDREYLLSIPTGYDRRSRRRSCSTSTGSGSNMQEQAAYTQLDAAGRRARVRRDHAERPGRRAAPVVTGAASANGNPTWRSCRRCCARPAARSASIRNRVFSTGMSNGAMFSTLLACALPGSASPRSRRWPGINATKACDAGTPRVSVLAFHGTADPIVPYQGGDYFAGAAAGRTPARAQALPVDDAVAAWARSTGAGPPRRRPCVADDVQHVVWPDCPANGTVALYRIVGVVTPGRVRFRCGRTGSGRRRRRSTRDHAHPRLLRRPPEACADRGRATWRRRAT